MQNMYAVTVSVGFGDYLETVARHNRRFFTEWYVVTDPNDQETHEVCRRHSLTAFSSERYREMEDDKFNKGKMINEGLKQVYKTCSGWVCHIDADIILLKGFRKRYEDFIQYHLPRPPEQALTGLNRVMCESREVWDNFTQTGQLTGMKPERKKINGVVCDIVRKSSRHIPVGFMQIWHTSKRNYYPENHICAATSDLKFGKQWGPHLRFFMEHERCIHLSREKWVSGRDWWGRKSKRWQ